MSWNPDRLSKAESKPVRPQEKPDATATHRLCLAKAVLKHPSGTVTTVLADGRVLQTRWGSRLLRRAPVVRSRAN
jgi:hypothetical protein